MKQAPVGPEERKSILKKIYHALRQSPMFTHYSVEHIRDSAIKSEQLTFNRSYTKQEYMQAMHAKLAKIEKSYVMNAEEILREMGNKSGQVLPEPIHITRPMGIFRDQMEKPPNPDMDEYQMHIPKKPEFVSLTGGTNRGINFSFIPDDPHAGRPQPRSGTPHMQPEITRMTVPPGMGLGGGDIPGAPSGYSHAMPINTTITGTEMYPGHVNVGTHLNSSTGSSHINNGHLNNSTGNSSHINNSIGSSHVGSSHLNSSHINNGHITNSHINNGHAGNSAVNNNVGHTQFLNPETRYNPKMGMHGINGAPGQYGFINVGKTRNTSIGMGAPGGRPAPMNHNIIKIDPLTDLGSIPSTREGRSEMNINPVEVNGMNMQRDALGGMNKSISQSMGRLEPFMPIGGFSTEGEANAFPRMGMEHFPEGQPINMGLGGISLGSVLHRTGAAGSTNTAAKMNSTRAPGTQFAKGTGVHEIKPVKVRQEEKAKVRPKLDKIESPLQEVSAESSPRPVSKKKESQTEQELKKISEEIEKMNEVLATHQSIFPRWEKQRNLFYSLEDVLNAKIKNPNEEIENIQGIFQQMKKHIIVLTQEIKEGDSLTFKKRMGRISNAFVQKQKTEPEYQFMTTEELLLEYN
ncbi:hypothetical protein NERG_02312 [Nematocida ausubeli]|uniref:Mediator complex subunit 15 KIX domain-containing protein n=1 Tax=Nematocida ausubeli (strain ATCC PRA-371 / ERTm2) TaxID=1913371 RepID=H8ZFE1_NEMA1|nr:hypothetical protein NERG_02312 [Nematocida ausubeli]